MKGFIIKQPWADLIFEGKKTWEIRGSNCKIRGIVGIVCEGKYIGTVEIIDAKELSKSEYKKSIIYHQIRDVSKMPYPKTFAWILTNPKRFKKQKSYVHKPGCVILVNL